MANKKITELDAITTLASTDVVPVVDVSADTTNKITTTNLFRTLPDGTAAAPALAFSSDQANGVYLAGTDTVGISTGGTQRVTVDGSGNVTISGDLTVSGATTTVESTTVTIDDKNIELGSVASPSNTTADGGGITLKGATDKTLKWINSTGSWTFNQSLHIDYASNNPAVFTIENNEGSFKLSANANLGLLDAAQHVFRNAAGSSEYARIDSSGNLGVGDSSPDARCVVYRATQFSGNTVFAVKSDADSTKSTKFMVDGDGKVGIGTTSPAQGPLHVHSSTTNAYFHLTNSTTGSAGSDGFSLHQSGNSTILNNRESDAMRFFTANTERLRIDSSGNVGIGTSSPTKHLVISSGGAAGMEIGAGNGSANGGTLIEHYNRSSSAYVQSRTIASDFLFNAGSNTFAIDSSGNVGIGTTSPQTELHLNDATGLSRIRLSGGASGADNFEFGQGTTGVTNGGFEIRDVDASATRFVIDSSGNVAIGSTSAPDRLNVGSTSNGFTAIRILTSNDGNGEVRFGDAGSGNAGYIRYAHNGNHLIFARDNTEAMRITSGGNVGIGTTSPRTKLDVSGGIYAAAGNQIQITGSPGSAGLQLIGNDSDASYVGTMSAQALVFRTNSAERLRIDTSGRLLLGTSSAQLSPTGSALQVSGNGFATSSVRQTRYESGISGASIILAHARGTEGSKAILNNNDEIGKIRFYGYDGSSFASWGAEIKAEVDDTPGTSDMPGRLIFSTNSGAGNATERMRIDRLGNVSIGNSTPINSTGYRTLTIGDGSTSGGQIHIEAPNGNNFQIWHGNTSVNFYAAQSVSQRFYTAGSERMRIDSSGRLLVGTSSARGRYTLQLEGNSESSTDVGEIWIGRPLVDASINSGTGLGKVYFGGQSGGVGAKIEGLADAQWGTNDYPGRLMFFTTADGASSPTERMRIDSSGRVGINETALSSFNTIADDLVISQASGSAGITVRSSTSGSGTLAFTDGANTLFRGDIRYVHNGDYMRLSTAGEERMRIDSSGRLLAGTTSSSGNFRAVFQGNAGNNAAGGDVVLARGAATPANAQALGLVGFSDNTHTVSGVIQCNRDGGTWSGSSKPTLMAFQTCADGSTTPTERMRINSSGHLSIGTTATNPGDNNTTTGSSINSNGKYFFSCASDGGHINRNNAGYILHARNNKNLVGGITVNSNSTAYNTSSDYRLKENVVDLDGAIGRVKQLAPKRFNFITAPDATVDGFLAHEAQTVVPEAVFGTHNGVEVWKEGEELPDGVSVGDNKLDGDGNTIPDYQGIDQSKLVPLLTAALQEAIAKIETLETKVAALEAQ